MIKVLLISVLLFCGAYGWRQRRLSSVVGIGLPIICGLGAIIVLRPELSNRLAQYLGVGRGADLILYLWMAVSLLLLANIHFRLRAQHAMITKLTREIALRAPETQEPEMGARASDNVIRSARSS